MAHPVRDTSTPVLVLGSAHHGGLAATRSLGKLGIDVYSVASSRWAPLGFSKYCKKAFTWDLERTSADESLAFFLDFQRQIGRPIVLVPITDLWAMFLADHCERLEGEFLFSPRNGELVRALHDKKIMACLAQKNGIPAPTIFCADTVEDLYDYADRTEWPVMFKASDGLELARRGLPSKVIVEKRSDLLKILDSVTTADLPYIMIQEYIPGDPSTVWMFEGYIDGESRWKFAITGKKIRQFPPYTGASCLAVCEPNDVVASIMREFLERVQYEGPVDAELRFDCRTGTYKVLDINCRAGATFRLFLDRNGMDIVRVLYCELTGQAIPMDEPCWRRRWVVEDYDAMSSLRYWLDGKLSAREWWQSLRGIDEGALFSRDDLAGSLAVFRADLINAAGRLHSRFTGNPQLSGR